MNTTATRFAALPAWGARAILLGLILLIGYGFFCQFESLSNTAETNPHGYNEDVVMYYSVVARLRQGQNYYAVAGDELRTRGYATRPFLNWRPPTLATLLAALPSIGAGRIVFGAFGLAVLAAWVLALRHAGMSSVLALVGAMLIGSALLLCLSKDGLVFHEFWSALCIALSLALYRHERWLPSVLLGVLAMFFRELALGYAVVMLAVALLEMRRRESLAWALGIVLAALALAWHAAIVSPLMLDSDRSKSWLVLGGYAFVLATAQWNVAIILLPGWVVPVLVPLTLLGLAAWRGPLGMRVALVTAAYAVAFMVFGHRTNIYWGLMYAPLLPLGWLFVLPALRDLWRAGTHIRGMSSGQRNERRAVE